MSATITAPAQRKVCQPILTPEQYAEADERYLNGETATVIAKDIGCKVNLLHTRFFRKRLQAEREKRLKQGRGERTKGKYAQISEEIADRLAGNTPKSLENLAVHADVAMKGAKVGALVHGWGEQTTIAIVMPGDITGDPEPEFIDVETEVQPPPERHQIEDER